VSNAGAASVNALNATTGAPLAGFNTITGLGNPAGLALSGNNLYVAQQSTNTISVYNATTGASIAPNFITTGLNQENGLAISGNTLYVANTQAFEVSEFNLTTGVLIGNISTGGNPAALAISGNALYVTLIGFPNQTNQLEAIDLTTGLPLAGFTTITGLNPAGDAVSGNDLYVTNNNTVEVFNAATGALINSNLISGLSAPSGLAVEAVPEASTWVIGLLAAVVLLAQIVRARRFGQQQKP
jgi:sugar lactone lactonase YvrE